MAVKQSSGGSAPDGSLYVTLADGAGNLNSNTSSYATPSSAGVTALQSSSGNVAAATATATLAGAASTTAYLTGFSFTGSGATAASVVNGTITGLLGGTMTFTVSVPAGATLGVTPVKMDFYPPIPASATNTSIVVSVPSLGIGNTNATVSSWGYRG